MSGFTDELKDKKIAQGEKLESEALIVAQKVLCNMGLDFLPASYVAFLRQYNGIKFDGSYLFGATVDDDLDIIDKNEELPHIGKVVWLGYNDFDLLGFDYDKKQYQIYDREDMSVRETFSEDEIDSALSRIFNV